MSLARPVVALLVGLLVAAPAAGAYVQPVFYFLKDAPSETDGIVPPSPVPPVVPIPIPIPTLDANPGILDPYDRNLQNSPNGTTAKARVVTAGTDLVLPIQFVTPAGHEHPDRIRGPIFVGLWTGESTVLHGNLTATLYEMPAGATPVPLANASVVLDFNQSKLPTDPSVLVPQNQSDPQAIVFYELAQVLPLVLHPPALFILGPVDIPFSPDSAFAIGFRLEQGSSPVPLPAGATATLQYDGVFAPSFVYVPWYAPDPVRPTSTFQPSFPSGTRTSNTLGGGMTTSDGGGDGDSKDSPGFGLLLGAAALALAAMAARRKMR